MTRPTFLFLHAQGDSASARAWQPLRDRLDDRDGLALDLHGFGTADAGGDDRMIGRFADGCPTAADAAAFVDANTAAEAQRRLNLPRHAKTDIHVVAGAAHRVPYEQPEMLAALIRDHAARGSPTPDQ